MKIPDLPQEWVDSRGCFVHLGCYCQVLSHLGVWVVPTWLPREGAETWMNEHRKVLQLGPWRDLGLSSSLAAFSFWSTRIVRGTFLQISVPQKPRRPYEVSVSPRGWRQLS